MNKLFNFAKVTGLVALLAFMFISAMPADSTAAETAVSGDTAVSGKVAAARDCDATQNTCFIRVNDDGSITVYDLGKLLAAN